MEPLVVALDALVSSSLPGRGKLGDAGGVGRGRENDLHNGAVVGTSTAPAGVGVPTVFDRLVEISADLRRFAAKVEADVLLLSAQSSAGARPGRRRDASGGVCTCTVRLEPLFPAAPAATAAAAAPAKQVNSDGDADTGADRDALDALPPPCAVCGPVRACVRRQDQAQQRVASSIYRGKDVRRYGTEAARKAARKKLYNVVTCVMDSVNKAKGSIPSDQDEVGNVCVKLYGWALDVLWSVEEIGADIVKQRTLQFAMVCLKLCDASRGKINHADDASEQLGLWVRMAPASEREGGWTYFDYMMERVPMRNPSPESLLHQVAVSSLLSPNFGREKTGADDTHSLLAGLEYCLKKWTAWLLSQRQCVSAPLIRALRDIWERVGCAIRQESHCGVLARVIESCSTVPDSDEAAAHAALRLIFLGKVAAAHFSVGAAVAKYDKLVKLDTSGMQCALSLAGSFITEHAGTLCRNTRSTLSLRQVVLVLELHLRSQVPETLVEVLEKSSAVTSCQIREGLAKNTVSTLYEALLAARSPLDALRRSDNLQALLSRTDAKPSLELCRVAYSGMQTFANAIRIGAQIEREVQKLAKPKTPFSSLWALAVQAYGISAVAKGHLGTEVHHDFDSLLTEEEIDAATATDLKAIVQMASKAGNILRERVNLRRETVLFLHLAVRAMSRLPFAARTSLRFAAHCSILANCHLQESTAKGEEQAIKSALECFSPSLENEELASDFEKCVSIAVSASLKLAERSGGQGEGGDDALPVHGGGPGSPTFPEGLLELRRETPEDTCKALDRCTVQRLSAWAKAINRVPTCKRPKKKDWRDLLAGALMEHCAEAHDLSRNSPTGEIVSALAGGLSTLSAEQRCQVWAEVLEHLRDITGGPWEAGTETHALFRNMLQAWKLSVDELPGDDHAHAAVFEADRLFFEILTGDRDSEVSVRSLAAMEGCACPEISFSSESSRIRIHLLCVMALQFLHLQQEEGFAKLEFHVRKVLDLWDLEEAVTQRTIRSLQYIIELLSCTQWSARFDAGVPSSRQELKLRALGLQVRKLACLQLPAGASLLATENHFLGLCAQVALGGTGACEVQATDLTRGCVYERELAILTLERNLTEACRLGDRSAILELKRKSLALRDGNDWVEETELLILASRASFHLGDQDTPGVVLATPFARSAVSSASRRKIASATKERRPRGMRALRAQLESFALCGVCYLLCGMDSLAEAVFNLQAQTIAGCWYLPPSSMLEALRKLRNWTAPQSDWLFGQSRRHGDRLEKYGSSRSTESFTSAEGVCIDAIWRCAGLSDATQILIETARARESDRSTHAARCAGFPWIQDDVNRALHMSETEARPSVAASFDTAAGATARNLRLVTDTRLSSRVGNSTYDVVRLTLSDDLNTVTVTRRQSGTEDFSYTKTLEDGSILGLLQKFRDVLHDSARGLKSFNVDHAADEASKPPLRRSASDTTSRPSRSGSRALSRATTDPGSGSRKELFWAHRRELDLCMSNIASEFQVLLGPVCCSLLLGSLVPPVADADEKNLARDDDLRTKAMCSVLCIATETGVDEDHQHDFDFGSPTQLLSLANISWDAFPSMTEETDRRTLIQNLIGQDAEESRLEMCLARWNDLCCQRFGSATLSEASMHVLNSIGIKRKDRVHVESVGDWKRETVIWCLDDLVQELPCESIPCHRGWPSTRMLEDSLVQPLQNPKLDVASVLLNPSSDPSLKPTEDRLAPTLESLGWSAVNGETRNRSEPFAETISRDCADIFVYCGHDYGQQAGLGTDAIMAMEHVPRLVLLFGCSSGALRGPRGIFGPSGIAQVWLAKGAEAVVGMLWDVTSQELDLFSNEVLQQYFQNSVPLAEAVEMARRKCRLPDMTGAAAVIYGAPMEPPQPICRSVTDIL